MVTLMRSPLTFGGVIFHGCNAAARGACKCAILRAWVVARWVHIRMA
jgi:hypothetical protein